MTFEHGPLLPFLVGLGLGLPLTWSLRALGWRLGQVDHQEADKPHSRAVPTTGGTAVLASVGLPIGLLSAPSGFVPEALLGHLPDDPTLGAFLFGALFLHVVGIVDDRRALGPWSKLWLQTAAALPLIALPEMQLLPQWLPGPVGAALALTWIVAIVNAVNFLDGADGVAGVVGIAAGGLFLVPATLTDQAVVGLVLALLVGALAAFLFFNLPPASVFLGDAGSLVVGFALAWASIRLTYYPGGPHPDAPWYALLTPVGILIVPLYDLATVTALRLLGGRSPFERDRRHLAHRLMARHFSPRQILVVVGSCTLAGGLGGALLMALAPWLVPLALAQTVAVVVLLALLEHSRPG